MDPNSGGEYIKCDFGSVEDRESFKSLSTIVGDAVHNLKCALDHVWFETVIRVIPKEKRVPRDKWRSFKFPVYPTSNTLEQALQNLQIHISAPSLYGFLVTKVKPYNGRDDIAIWPVHDLDRRDKHRLLIPIIHYTSVGDIHLQDQYGQFHKGETWGTALPFPHVIGPFELGIHIKDPGSLSFEVVFEEDGAGAEATLRIYSRYILKVVELFEEFVES